MKRLPYREIAEKAGVSVSTVYRAVSVPDPSSQSCRKVRDAISALGGNPMDYGLSDRRGIIVFVSPYPSNPFYAPIIASARSVVRSHRYVLLADEEDIMPETVEDFIAMLSDINASGVIAANPMGRELAETIDKSFPVVMCSESAPGSSVPFVMVDNEGAAFNAVRYLASLGCRRIAMLNGPSSYRYAIDRFAGYRRALEESGLGFQPEYAAEIGSHMDFEMAAAVLSGMLGSTEPPDALFCVSDSLAALAIHIASERGMRVPDDILIMGFDDGDVSKMATPSISTIRQPVGKLGMLAAEMLIRRMESKDDIPASICLDTELIIRASTRR